MTVLSNLIPKNQTYHMPDKTLKFVITKMQNTQSNHKDFNKVIKGLEGKGLEGNNCSRIYGARNKRLKAKTIASQIHKMNYSTQHI